MKIRLAVTENSGETYEVETNLFVIVAWERRFKRKASDLADAIGAEDLAFLAWEACKQVNIPVPAVFDDYVKRLANLEVASEETTNPTDAGLTATA